MQSHKAKPHALLLYATILVQQLIFKSYFANRNGAQESQMGIKQSISIALSQRLSSVIPEAILCFKND